MLPTPPYGSCLASLNTPCAVTGMEFGLLYSTSISSTPTNVASVIIGANNEPDGVTTASVTTVIGPVHLQDFVTAVVDEDT